jgi:16S rRNA (cytidine1402-2'-O)-methyltransferase
MSYKLYVVGTPIGNLEDISPHAIRILREASLVASENPSRTQRLLARYGIETPMTRFTDAYDRRKAERMQAVLEALLQGDVAFVTEAGMPLLADPGHELIQAVLERGIEVVPVPGPTAMMAALALSGLPAVPFSFLGFLPRRSSARRDLLSGYVGDLRTLVAYESPNRLVDTLVDVQAVLGSRQVVVANELTKLYEEIWRGEVGAAIAHFQAHPPRGEYAVVIGGAGAMEESLWSDTSFPNGPSSRGCSGQDLSDAD